MSSLRLCLWRAEGIRSAVSCSGYIGPTPTSAAKGSGRPTVKPRGALQRFGGTHVEDAP